MAEPKKTNVAKPLPVKKVALKTSTTARKAFAAPKPKPKSGGPKKD